MLEEFENVTNVSSCGCVQSRNHEEGLMVDKEREDHTKCVVIGGKETKTIMRWSKEKGIHLSTLNPE